MILKNKFKYLLFVLFLSSCGVGDGYRVENGKVVFERPWNAGSGTKVYTLDADPKTFQVLGEDNLLWAKDINNVYLRGGKLDFLNSKTFVLLTDLFGKDDKTVVCDYQPIKEADVVTFKVKKFKDINGRAEVLGIDNHAAYKCYDGGYSYRPVDSIETFELLYEVFYRDENNVYWWGSRLPLNVNELKLMSGFYIADKNHVYYGDELVKGADTKTFMVTSERTAQDRNYKYESEKRVKSINGIDKLFSIEIWNEIDNLVKKPKKLRSGEVVQVWVSVDKKIDNFRIYHRDQLIFSKAYGDGGLNAGARSVVHGNVVNDSVKLEEISSLTIAWKELESGLEREVTVDVKGLIPESYNGSTLRFKVIDPDHVAVEFARSK